MKVTIECPKILKLEENRVTSPLTSIPHYKKDLDNFPYHPDGIFSKRIFGNLYKCDCGELKEEGFCEKCETRVVTYENMPDFFIQLPIDVLYRYATLDDLTTKLVTIDMVEKLAKYQGFLIEKYDTKILNAKKVAQEDGNAENNDESGGNVAENGGNAVLDDQDDKTAAEIILSNYDFIDTTDEEYDGEKYASLGRKILYGKEALEALTGDTDWLEKNMSDVVLIPHTIYRPLIVNNDQTPFTSKINSLYIQLIEMVQKTEKIIEMASNPIYLLATYARINEIKETIDKSILEEIQENKYSIVRSEVISHPITGAARATFLNRHDVHEDVLLVGDTLVETLWPYLYKKHRGDMVEINKELVENDYSVLLNRPPTIAHLSIIAMKPRIASIYPLGYTEGTNRCLLHNEKYVSEHPERIGKFKYSRKDSETRDDKLLVKSFPYNLCNRLEFGDIEEFGSGINWSKESVVTVKEEFLHAVKFKAGELGVLEVLEDKIIDEEGNECIAPSLEGRDELEIKDLTDGLYRVSKLRVQGEWDGIDNLGVRSIACNAIMVDGLSGDFDGDTLLIVALYGNESLAEAATMRPSKAYMNYANNVIRNHIVEDFIYIVNEKDKEEALNG